MEKENNEKITYKIISWSDVEERKISAKEVYEIFDQILELYYYYWWFTEYHALRKILKYWYERLDITNLIQKFTVLVVAYNSEWKLIWFARWFWDWYKRFYIEDVFINKEYKGKWIASLMLNELILFVRKNYSYSSITVISTIKAEEFFKKERFKSLICEPLTLFLQAPEDFTISSLEE